MTESMPSVPAPAAEPGRHEVAGGAAEPGRNGAAADPLAIARYLDVALLVAAAPFVILLGAPALGYAVAAAAWIALRFAAAAVERRAARQQDYRAALGLNLVSVFTRAWLVGLTILAIGLIAGREDGLTAGITLLVAFTVYFATSLILRPLERNAPRA
jgi:hypothetical protein